MKRREDGFVSLFTTIMISLLLIIITTSLVTLEVLQLRKSEDSEQSMRAYYAAEAGVEAAVQKILANPFNHTNQDCSNATISSNTTYDTAGAANWTCQRISFSGSPVGKLDADAAKTVDPGKANYSSVIIEWGTSVSPGLAGYSVTPGGLPSAGSYAYAAPPIEIAMVTYPDDFISTSQVGSAVKLENALIVPRGNGLYKVDSGTLPNHGQWDGTLPNHGQWDGNCAPIAGPSARSSYNFGTINLGGYNCYAVITNLSAANDYLFRIRSRYQGTSYRMTFATGMQGDGTIVKVPDGTATIDVTAKAGDAHRRVLTKLPLGAGAAPGLDYVIYSDGDICKNFSVINNAFPAPVPGGGC